MAIQKEKHTLPLKSLNHVSRVCRNVHATTHFYEKVLGFIPIVRPGALKFDGAWLHNYGISVHLLQAENQELATLPPVEKEINSRDDHLSFQVCRSVDEIVTNSECFKTLLIVVNENCLLFLQIAAFPVVGQSDSILGVEQALQDHGIKYTRTTIDENGVQIEQVFFHDPDGFMIEICTCEKFPVQPLIPTSASICNLAPALSAR
uniref:VOC domain-containing protein n=1 Tax=Physcomitrium patens TaxID=3218 RepID=A0A7I4EBV2_PHYPA